MPKERGEYISKTLLMILVGVFFAKDRKVEEKTNLLKILFFPNLYICMIILCGLEFFRVMNVRMTPPYFEY